MQPVTPPNRAHQAELWSALYDTLLNASDDVAAIDLQRVALEQYLTANPMKAKAIKPALCRQQIMLYELTQK